MLTVSYLPYSDSSGSGPSLTALSRTEPVENIPPPRRARRSLHHQDVHDPGAEAAGLPRTEP